MSVPSTLKPILLKVPGVAGWRRARLLRRYTPLAQPWDGGYLDKTLGILRLSGSWREIGRAVARIGGGNEFVSAGLATLARLPESVRRDIHQRAERAFVHTARALPQLPQLLDGFCDGSSMPREDVVLAHCITAVAASLVPRSCGAIAWMTPTGPVIGQSLDLGLINDTAVALVEPTDGISFVCHMNVGTLWFATGINAPGVVIGGASVTVRRDLPTSPDCFVHPFVDLLVLANASSRTAAIELLRAARPYGGAGEGSAHVVADRNSLSTVEIAHDRVVEHVGSPAVVTNHFELDGMPALEAGDPDAARSRQLSVCRRGSALAMLAHNPSHDVATLTAFVEAGDRSDSWNRSAVAPDDGWTTARYVIDVPGRRFTSWQGPRPGCPTPVSLDLAILD